MNKKYYLIILTLILVSANCSYSISLKDRAIKIFNKALPSYWVCNVKDISMLKDDRLLQITGNTPTVLCTLECYTRSSRTMNKKERMVVPKYSFYIIVNNKWGKEQWNKYKNEYEELENSPASACELPLKPFYETEKYSFCGKLSCPNSIKILLVDLLNKL
ncbi:MAG: hypothetical protein Q7V00_03515 [Sulfurimicrobium sp.]|nr:hypothetical protein [Sulfurimicrobium sp.]